MQPEEIPLDLLCKELRKSQPRVFANFYKNLPEWHNDGTPRDEIDVIKIDIMEEAARRLKGVEKCLN